LRQVHTRIIGLIEDRSTNVQFQGDSIVLDLHAILLQVAQQFGVSDPDGLLARVDLPPDAGQIVLVEDAGYIKTGADIAQRHQTITNATAIATIVTFLLAILVSRSRRATVRTVGYVLIAVGVIASVILFPIRSIAASFAQNPSAAKAAFNELVLNYREQAFVMMLIGLLIAGVAALFGQTALARAVRSGGRGPGVQAELREAAPALRIGALAVGALVLIAWPDPSRRVYVTAFFLLAVFLAVLWIITTESEWGTSLRERTERAWSRITAEGDTQGSHRWFAGHAGQLRVLGILVTIAAILFWPSLTFAGFAALVAAGLLYLAAVEWLATRPASAHQ
jgi:hypothetical protein